MKSVIRFVFAAWVLCATACSEEIVRRFEETASLPPVERTNSPQIICWAKLSLDNDLKSRYRVERVFLSGGAGEKIGMALGELNGRWKIVLPKDFEGAEHNFTIEFSRESSYLDSIPALKANPLALGILKAFHYTTPDDHLFTVPANGGQVEITGFDALGTPRDVKLGDLVMGYSRNSEDILANIQNIPPLYKLEIDQSAMISQTSAGYRAYVGIATEQGEPLPNFSNIIINGIDPTSYSGFAAGDDWYLVLNDTSLVRGDAITLTILYTGGGLPGYVTCDFTLPDLFGVIPLAPSPPLITITP